MSPPPLSAGGGGGANSALDIQLLIFECVALSQGSFSFGTRSPSLADGRDCHTCCFTAARCAPETSRDEQEPLRCRVDPLDRADVGADSSERVLALLVLSRRDACVRDETWREGAQEALLEECASGGLPGPCSSAIGSNCAALRAKPLTPSNTTPSEAPSAPKISRSAPSPVCEGRAAREPESFRAMHSVPSCSGLPFEARWLMTKSAKKPKSLEFLSFYGFFFQTHARRASTQLEVLKIEI